MPLTPLPTPPSRDDPANFADEADAFLGALPTFATELNALAVNVELVDESAEAIIGAANFKGEYNAGTAYLIGESVSYNEQVYIAKTNNTGVTPANGANWFLLERIGVSAITAIAALDINCSLGNYFTKTIAGNSTFTFSSPPATRAFSFTLELTHTSGTVTWPASVKWPRDTAPTLSTGKTHLFTFVTDDGGTRWRGAALVDYVT